MDVADAGGAPPGGLIEIVTAPSNLGLRPPAPGREPGTWRAPHVLLSHGLGRRLNAVRIVELPRPRYEFQVRAGAAAGAATELPADQIVAMLRAAAEGIKARGRSDVGDKTLLDAIVPAIDTLEAQIGLGHDAATTLRAAAETARERAEATRSMQAMRGRPGYTGERSIGTLDAGAIAVAVMFEAIADKWQDRDDPSAESGGSGT